MGRKGVRKGAETKPRGMRFGPVWKAIVMAAVLGVLLLQTRPGRIVQAWHGMASEPFVWALVLLIPNIGIQLAKWGYLVRRVRPEMSIREVISSLFIGFSFGMISPGRMGEMARGLGVPGESRTKMAGLTLVDRGHSFAVTAIAATIGLMMLYPRIACAPGLVVICAMVWVCLQAGRLRAGLRRLAGRLPFRERTSLLIDSLESLDPGVSLRLLIFSLAFNLIFFAQFHLLLSAFAGVSWVRTMPLIPMVFVIKVLFPITLIDLGVREFASIALFGRIGVEQAGALNASFLLFLIDVVVPGLVGLAFLGTTRIAADDEG